jgi:hypothetical protein
MKKLLVVLVSTIALPALASQPGQPLDCSDWVFLEPGHSCAMFAPIGSAPPASDVLSKGTNRVTDNSGNLLFLRRINMSCRNVLLQLIRFDAQGEHVVGYIQDRDYDGCSSPFRADRILPTENSPPYQPEVISFDPINGRVLIPLRSYCQQALNDLCGTCYACGWWVAAVGGFSPLFDILQTYTPAADAFQFRVPAHPEGLRAADHFDTYWGHVSDLPDFTQAHAMQCHFPATPPTVGDYLTVADTSPQPSPGYANYIVTAVTSGSQRRYGRKLIAGVISGRDPALLPGCP